MAAPLQVTPLLESGDHLTRDEFHRRYLNYPEIRRSLSKESSTCPHR